MHTHMWHVAFLKIFSSENHVHVLIWGKKIVRKLGKIHDVPIRALDNMIMCQQLCIK